MSRLGVNIDHIATLRQARRIKEPDPFEALAILHECRVDQVTCHLREDRRHIQDHDVTRLVQAKILPVNLELASSKEMVSLALQIKPHTVTLVPEKREEITTEGGLDVVGQFFSLKEIIPQFHHQGIRVSLFIDPDFPQLEAAAKLGVEGVEFHTGAYAEVFGTMTEDVEYDRLYQACKAATNKNLGVYAGHGLNVKNLKRLTAIKEIQEYNIGHSIIGRAVFIGLKAAIDEIKSLLA